MLAVIGPYRTGKSYLMNRFAGYQKGFELGGSTNPCTHGIWIWGKPMRLNDNTSLLLLDSEGLGILRNLKHFLKESVLKVLTLVMKTSMQSSFY